MTHTRSLLAALLLCSTLTPTVCAQTAEFFTPVRPSELRLPSVPLLVNDPYFSYWSPYDKLTDGTTRHWSNAEKSIDGLLRVDGTVYRWMGTQRECVLASIVPMTNEELWTAKVSYAKENNWEKTTFDDSSWKTEKAAWGTADEYPRVKTSWTATNSDIYIRRPFTLTAADLQEDLWVMFSHDDVFELYINGTRVVSTGETWLQGERQQLTAEQKALLHEGENLIAAHCHNTSGGAYVDFGLFRNTMTTESSEKTATQTACTVMATSTYYTFTCGPVTLDVVFTAPFIIDDLDLLSTPVNYISYRVQATDGEAHDVQFYVTTTPQMVVEEMTQSTTSTIVTQNGRQYIRSGSVDQPVLKRTGDLISIDWGYLYLPAVNGEVAIAPLNDMENSILADGTLAHGEETINSVNESQFPLLAYRHDFGSTTDASSYMLFGYDEVYDIQYMQKNYKGYWARNGKTIFEAFEELDSTYTSVMERCRQQDITIYDDGLAAGNAHYAELLAASYRQVIAAHKLFEDASGNLLFFSKENNSNGCVNTVDLTYPSAPLFLIYNPALEKGMITSIYEYSRSGRWTKGFAAHDLGTYPKANGQVYGGDMPIEESGNMLTLTAAIMMQEGWTDWARKYWNTAKRWADYLVKYGQDPAEQLCTDDFAGHWAHNCNLSVKAIMGIAAFAKMCYIRAEALESDTYKTMGDTYMQTAREMAVKWESDARDGDHYRLAFDREGTWSQKYNMVWDKLWQTNLFPNRPAEREIRYYLTKQNTYGLPLDSRETYTKSDWIMWTAAMSPNTKTFLRFLEPVYKYVNETRSRVPLCDWYQTKSGNMQGFRARSVIGGHWMKVLMDKTIGTDAPVWQPADESVLTRWGAAIDTASVLPEYPRPSLQRDAWMNLNGLWEYAITTTMSEPSSMAGQILVPFPAESSLSGVGTTLDDGSYLWYKCTFTLPSEWEGQHLQLNFGAVDYSCYVWLNGKVVTRNHVGGYNSFTADITDWVTFDQPNTLLLRAVDANNGDKQAVGNQRLNPLAEGHHQSVSGIWQTVWVEPVGEAHITSVHTSTDLQTSTLTLVADVAGTTEGALLQASLLDAALGTVCAEGTAAIGAPLALTVSQPHLWSPDDPYLYDLELMVTRGDTLIDRVHSYAALRTIATGTDSQGHPCLLLNGEPLFMLGVIDDGLWPDGLYTAPSDEALAYDVEQAKSMGYNTLRKHQKVEPDRWYWHADRLGMLVWQDMPSLTNSPETWTPDGWYTGKDGTQSASVNNAFRTEWTTLISQLSAHPSIVVWTPFEEARGQYKTADIVALTRESDGSRLVDAASGGNHHQGAGDVLDLHVDAVPSQLSFSDPERPLVFGRCGIAGSNPSTTDYTAAADALCTLAATTSLSAAMTAVLASPASETEGSVSLLSYDRTTATLDAAAVTAANKALIASLQCGSSIEATCTDEPAITGTCYNILGIEVPASTGGIVIVRRADGTVSKQFNLNR